jgi:hypothetical protein
MTIQRESFEWVGLNFMGTPPQIETAAKPWRNTATKGECYELLRERFELGGIIDLFRQIE